MGTVTNSAFHLSVEQSRLWQEQPADSSAFLAQCETALRGPLDRTLLKQAIRRVVESNEILRTAFRIMPGMKTPFQVIEEAAAFDWTEAAAGEVESLRIALRKPFDLEAGNCLRAGLVETGPGEHLLLLALPALCADSVSLTNLIAEIGNAYEGRSAGESLQYPDVVEWQREMLAAEESKTGREFWRRYFEEHDFPASIRASEAFSRASDSDAFAPDEFAVPIDANLYSPLRDAASTINVTVAEFLLASWASLFARLTSSDRIAIRCNFDGRSFAELGGALGLFAKDIPIAFGVSVDGAFRALAAEVKARVSEAGTWQDSFPGTESSTIPLGFEHARLAGPAEYAKVLFAPLSQSVNNRRIALNLSVGESAAGLNLSFRFDGARLDRADVQRWSRHFLSLLEAAATDPSTPISRLPLLNADDAKTLLEDWNRTEAGYPRDLCLHELFERQAEQTPARNAVVDAGRAFTYGEVNDRANRLAHYLGGKGVSPGARVGLLVDRSVDVMVAIVAIMKAGAAYVPLSAEDPKARLAQRLNTVSLVVTEQKLATLLPASVKTIILDRDDWSSESSANPERLATPEDLAYVLYTSGSTGVPKGVGIRHRNLVNYSWYICRLLEVERYPEGLNFASVTTISADLGNTCIYPSLISGGCLHLIPHDVGSETGRMAEYCRNHKVDVLKIVPSHLSALIGTSEGRDVLPRRYLISGGEALTWDLVERIESLGGTCELINHYGPTETTVGSLTLRVADYKGPKQPGGRVPIGRPIANTQLYIVDSSGAPVPAGVTGELYIGGDGVAAGYVNEPSMTAERFIENPWKPGTRMYRTGDVCRYRSDGVVEILGRGDDQIKIRGYRIEIGEIEAAIRDYAGISAAVVIARPDDRGERRLIAYVVSADGRSLDTEALKAHLNEHLPSWMIPAAIVSLLKLPLTANGKIDRQALPDPATTATGNRELTAPRNATEEGLLGIWREVFRRDEIGVEDNFFDIGGHSLMATQVVSRLNKRFQVSPPASIIFEYPTIAGLAAWIADATPSSAHPAEPLVRVPRDGALPLSFAQQRLWVIDQFDTGNPMYNVVRTLRMGGALDLSLLEQALNEIVRRHESQRTIFESRNGEPVQVILPQLRVPIEQEDFSSGSLEAAETRARECLTEESSRRFDLAKPPLLRAKCLRLATDDHVLILSMHHIVSDGWSAAVFFNELSALYSAFAAGQPSPLLELAIQYADYAAWQRKSLSGVNLTRQLDYWRKQLSGAPSELALPFDRPHTDNGSHEGTYELVELPRELTAPIAELGREADATLFMTLLAGYQAMLGFYSRQDKIVIGTDVANRPNPETEALIGFFVNLLPICTDLSGDPKFRDLLARVRETAVGAYAHQDLPFDKLVEELRPERRFGQNPIVQSLFVMQNIPVPKSGFAGLSVRPFETPVGWSKFDLALFMIERERGLAGCWVYRSDLFDRATILEMAACYELLLRAVVESPDIRLGKLGILMQEERARRREKTPKKQFQRQKLAKAAPQGEEN